MAVDRLDRKLAAILYADVAGYSRLTGENEEGTHRALSACLDLLSAQIETHAGKVVHYAGDAVLAEFGTALDAVACGVDAQRALRARNESIPERDRVEFRIGINLGDVIVDRDDIYGDGVNIAARLESLAEPGGICISGTVHDALGARHPVVQEYTGEHSVKHIAQPVRVYRLLLDGEQAGSAGNVGRLRSGRVRARALALGLIGAATALAAAWWWGMVRDEPARDAAPDSETANVVATARDPPGQQSPIDGTSRDAPAAAERPSIAVLPFNNLSNDPEQEYFSDGLTEDLITDLSKVSGLFVIARNSSFTYRGQAVNVQQVGRELGVRYVLEGSVRRAASQVRINAQLIDAHTGLHLWAERYDRELTGVFALQDEVTRTIVQALAVKLTRDEEATLSSATRVDPDAYDVLLRGNAFLHRFTPQETVEARAHFLRAIELDPGYARAHANLSFTHSQEVFFGWTPDRETSIRDGLAAANRANDLDARIPQVHFAFANLYSASGRQNEAARAARRAIELDPNYADAYAVLAASLTLAGELDEALEAINISMRLNPRYSFAHLWVLGRVLYIQGRFAEAARVLEEAARRNPQFDQVHIVLGGTYAQLGRIDDAAWEVEETLSLRPDFSIARELEQKGFVRTETRTRYAEGLRKAGFPD